VDKQVNFAVTYLDTVRGKQYHGKIDGSERGTSNKNETNGMVEESV
jgi:hypothetical protein